jgi:signal transduction histidine kinase/ActR/RegA family two-component response regulator
MQHRRGPTLSLRHLLVLLTAIGLLPLALLGIWGIHVASEYRQREQERAMLDLARALSSAVDAELDSSVAALSGMAHSPAMMAGDVRAFYEMARVQAQAQPEWLGVILADDTGKILFRTNAPLGATLVPADPVSLQLALNLHRPVVGRITRGLGGRPAVPVRIPVTDGHGRAYVLSAVVRPDRILRVIERQRAPSDSVIAVIDAYGYVVARSKNQDRFVTRPITDKLQDLMRQHGPEGAGPTKVLEGDPVITAYSRMSRYGWSVAVNTPPATLRAAFFEGIAVYAAGIALSLAVCIALAYWLSSRIVAAFNSLRVAAAAVGAGRPVSVPSSRIRELGRMGRALEDALRRQQEALEQARSAGQAKDEFLAVLGHELRNPLSPIVTSLDLMDMRDEPGARRERVIMRRQVTHLKRLVDDLLDVSRIATGKLQLELKPLNLADTVRHAVAALPGHAISLQAPDAVWVEGDESRLVQVLNNLLSNAARFGSSATSVHLRVERKHAVLSVSDNGIGMDGDLLSRVFEPFFQAPQQLARRTGGLGLGLAIVRKIVDLHGGSVSAASAGHGQGSRFEVVLPLAAEAPAAPEAPPLAAQQASRVLLVDDNEDAASGTAQILRQLGHTVEVAHSAAEALAAARAAAPEVAILDIGLPDMDGCALAGAMRAVAGGAALRLVALTGYGQQADVARAAQAGFDLHLTKPASLDELRAAVGLRASAS